MQMTKWLSDEEQKHAESSEVAFQEMYDVAQGRYYDDMQMKAIGRFLTVIAGLFALGFVAFFGFVIVASVTGWWS